MLDADGADPLRKMMRVQIIVCIMSFFVASASVIRVARGMLCNAET